MTTQKTPAFLAKLKALQNMTVKNGCTTAEARNAARLLTKLVVEHGVTIDELRGEQKETFNTGYQAPAPQSQPVQAEARFQPPVRLPLFVIALILLGNAAAEKCIPGFPSFRVAGVVVSGSALFYLSLWARHLIKNYELRSLIQTLMAISILAFMAGMVMPTAMFEA
jgi:hypothetical protein